MKVVSRSYNNGIKKIRRLLQRLSETLTGNGNAKAKRRDLDQDYRAYVGPAQQYDFMGATQFRLLTALGLREEHYLLDIGCGSLRAGRLFIPYLLAHRYHGIEPNKFLIDEAIANETGADLIRLKRPRFAHNADFDYSVFGRQFDYIVAQSVFSHTGADLAEHGLSGLQKVMHGETITLVTFKLAEPGADVSMASGWVYPGTVPFDEFDCFYFNQEGRSVRCAAAWFHPRQTWFLLATDRNILPSQDELISLRGEVLRDRRFDAKR